MARQRTKLKDKYMAAQMPRAEADLDCARGRVLPCLRGLDIQKTATITIVIAFHSRTGAHINGSHKLLLSPRFHCAYRATWPQSRSASLC